MINKTTFSFCYNEILEKEALFDWEVKDNMAGNYDRNELMELNRKQLISIIKIDNTECFLVPELAIVSALQNGRTDVHSLSAFCNLEIKTIREILSKNGNMIEITKNSVNIKKQKGRLIVFDWSGTLVNEFYLDEEVCKYIPHPKDGNRERYRNNFIDFEEHLRNLEEKQHYLWYDYLYLGKRYGKTEEDLRKIHEINYDKVQGLFRFENIKKLRRKGFKIALVTDCVEKVLHWRGELLKIKIEDEFDYIVTSDRVRYVEDKRKHLELLMKESKIKPDDAIYIGDSFVKDILAAKTFNMRTIWFKNSIRNAGSRWGTPTLPVSNTQFSSLRKIVNKRAADAIVFDIENVNKFFI